MSRSTSARPLLSGAAFLTVLLTGLLSGCGSSPPGPASPSGSAAGGSTDPVVTAARSAVEAGYQGSFGSPPQSGPPPAAGKKVWVLSAFQQITALAYTADEEKQAGEALGWQVKVCDGQNNAGGAWATCVRQAVADKADGVILNAIDCAPVQQALVEARAAGVKVASTSAYDCSDPKQGGSQPLVDAPVVFAGGVRDLADYHRRNGVLRAQQVIARSGGKARILHVEFKGVALGDYLAEGFTEGIKTCPGCAVAATVTITPPEIAQIRQKFETALLRAPDVDTVVVDVDFMFSAGIQQALTTSNRKGLDVIGGECSAESLGYIRAGGGQKTCIGNPLGYLGWASVDGLNRVFNGQPAADSGIGLQIVDAERNLPSQGEQFEGPVDFRSAYKAAWGLG